MPVTVLDAYFVAAIFSNGYSATIGSNQAKVHGINLVESPRIINSVVQPCEDGDVVDVSLNVISMDDSQRPSSKAFDNVVDDYSVDAGAELLSSSFNDRLEDFKVISHSPRFTDTFNFLPTDDHLLEPIIHPDDNTVTVNDSLVANNAKEEVSGDYTTTCNCSAEGLQQPQFITESNLKRKAVGVAQVYDVVVVVPISSSEQDEVVKELGVTSDEDRQIVVRLVDDSPTDSTVELVAVDITYNPHVAEENHQKPTTSVSHEGVLHYIIDIGCPDNRGLSSGDVRLAVLDKRGTNGVITDVVPFRNCCAVQFAFPTTALISYGYEGIDSLIMVEHPEVFPITILNQQKCHKELIMPTDILDKGGTTILVVHRVGIIFNVVLVPIQRVSYVPFCSLVVMNFNLT